MLEKVRITFEIPYMHYYRSKMSFTNFLSTVVKTKVITNIFFQLSAVNDMISRATKLHSITSYFYSVSFCKKHFCGLKHFFANKTK